MVIQVKAIHLCKYLFTWLTHLTIMNRPWWLCVFCHLVKQLCSLRSSSKHRLYKRQKDYRQLIVGIYETSYKWTQHMIRELRLVLCPIVVDRTQVFWYMQTQTCLTDLFLRILIIGFASQDLNIRPNKCAWHAVLWLLWIGALTCDQLTPYYLKLFKSVICIVFSRSSFVCALSIACFLSVCHLKFVFS